MERYHEIRFTPLIAKLAIEASRNSQAAGPLHDALIDDGQDNIAQTLTGHTSIGSALWVYGHLAKRFLYQEPTDYLNSLNIVNFCNKIKQYNLTDKEFTIYLGAKLNSQVKLAVLCYLTHPEKDTTRFFSINVGYTP